MSKIRVAIAGVGNCANALLQAIHYYGSGAAEDDGLPLVRPMLGGYQIQDIEVVCAFDVNETKVGKYLHQAVWSFPNETFRMTHLPPYKGIVYRGPTLDGIGQYMADFIKESMMPPDDVVGVLQDHAVDVLINYLPVGSEKAAEFYADAAIQAGCGFINCIPVFLASKPEWEKRFLHAKLPIIGDDIKSQVGATIVHRVLAQLFRDRGVKLTRTMQLNVGGNGDFLTMLERERLKSKKTSKTQAVVSVAGADHLTGKDIHIGPSDYVEWLGDRKWAYIRLEGLGLGGAPLNIELKLEVWDSPNSAGIVIDAIRCAKLARDRGEGGAILAPSAYFMKSPPIQRDDNLGLEELEAWIADRRNKAA